MIKKLDGPTVAAGALILFAACVFAAQSENGKTTETNLIPLTEGPCPTPTPSPPKAV